MANAISPGDVRTFNRGDGKAVVVGLGLWAERQGKWISIHMTGPNHSHTSVSNNPQSTSFHRTLFRDLRRTLVTEGCWQFDEEGSEAEAGGEYGRFQPVPLLGGASASEIIIAERGE